MASATPATVVWPAGEREYLSASRHIWAQYGSPGQPNMFLSLRTMGDRGVGGRALTYVIVGSRADKQSGT
jgi:hypothetical protein